MDSLPYATLTRLLRLRDVLRPSACTASEVCLALPDDYPLSDTGQRKLRRDLDALVGLGYHVERQSRPAPPRWRVVSGPLLLDDTAVQALVYIRAAFPPGSPYTPSVTALLSQIAEHLTPTQQEQWLRTPAVQLTSAPARDYSHTAPLVHRLQQAIVNRRQVSLVYHAREQLAPICHPRLDVYQILWRDNHFYLEAYSYRSNRVLLFRLDRIVYAPDADPPSPNLLPAMQPLRRSNPSIRFVYRITANFARTGASTRFTIEDVRYTGEHAIITASHPNELDIIRTLLAYGEHACLLAAPPDLMQRMQAIIAAMHANYNGNPPDIPPPHTTEIPES